MYTLKCSHPGHSQLSQGLSYIHQLGPCSRPCTTSPQPLNTLLELALKRADKAQSGEDLEGMRQHRLGGQQGSCCGPRLGTPQKAGVLKDSCIGRGFKKGIQGWERVLGGWAQDPVIRAPWCVVLEQGKSGMRPSQHGQSPEPANCRREWCVCGQHTSVSLMISPELRHSFLLSSSTVFMFSIQTASTGPSNMYHFLLVSGAMAPARMREEKIPSVL